MLGRAAEVRFRRELDDESVGGPANRARPASPSRRGRMPADRLTAARGPAAARADPACPTTRRIAAIAASRRRAIARTSLKTNWPAPTRDDGGDQATRHDEASRTGLECYSARRRIASRFRAEFAVCGAPAHQSDSNRLARPPRYPRPTMSTIRSVPPSSIGPASRAAHRRAELDEPRAGEVRVRMLASGVCHSDLHVRDGEWDRPGPIVMGHEGAGVIEALGPGVDASGRRASRSGGSSRWRGRRRAARCRSCLAGRRLGVPGLAVLHPPDAGRHVAPAAGIRRRRGPQLLRDRDDGGGVRSSRPRPRSRCRMGRRPTWRR